MASDVAHGLVAGLARFRGGGGFGPAGARLVGHVFMVWPGLLTHSPSLAQPGQSSCTSLHTPLHTPHVTGQCTFMKPAFAAHWPSLPQWLQSVCRSAHLGAQRPQEVGHSLFM